MRNLSRIFDHVEVLDRLRLAVHEQLEVLARESRDRNTEALDVDRHFDDVDRDGVVVALGGE